MWPSVRKIFLSQATHVLSMDNTTVKPGVSKLFLVNNLALVNIFCFPKSHFQHKSPIDSKQPGVSKLFAA